MVHISLALKRKESIPIKNSISQNFNFIELLTKFNIRLFSQITWPNLPIYSLAILYTVSALFEPRGSIFQNGFLSGVLLIFDLPGVVIETGVY